MNHTTKVSWTPEPWKVDNVDYPTDIYASPDEKHIGPTLIAQTKNVDYPYLMAQANATRIVSCINGCAGLNPAAYRACVETLTDVVAAFEEEPVTGDVRLDGIVTRARRALTKAEQQL